MFDYFPHERSIFRILLEASERRRDRHRVEYNSREYNKIESRSNLRETYSEMKSLKFWDQLDGLFKVGGGFRIIWNSALVGCISWNGGFPSANSIAVIPIAQTSALFPYPSELFPLLMATSGAIQLGDPTQVYLFPISAWHVLDRPKSTNFISPSLVSNILLPRMSRCITLFSFR